MNRLLILSALLGGTVLLSGCGIFPMKGQAVAPITLDHISSDPIVDNSVRPVKHGRSQSKGVILFHTGDASIGAAMRDGGITKVHHVDYDVKNILFLYNETTTIVYGE